MSDMVERAWWAVIALDEGSISDGVPTRCSLFFVPAISKAEAIGLIYDQLPPNSDGYCPNISAAQCPANPPPAMIDAAIEGRER